MEEYIDLDKRLQATVILRNWWSVHLCKI